MTHRDRPQANPLLLLAALISVWGIGCDGGQVGEEPARCNVVSSTTLSVDELSPLGFRPMDLLSAIEGQHSAEIRWADSRTGTLSLTVTYAGSATYLEREWGSAEAAAELEAFDCMNVLELSMTTDVSTADNTLDQSWTQTLQADSADSALLSRDLQDDFDPTPFAPAGDWDSLHSWIQLTISAGEPTGTMGGQTSKATGDVVQSESFDIAAIGPPSL